MIPQVNAFAIESRADSDVFFSLVHPIQIEIENRYVKHKHAEFFVQGYCPACKSVDLRVDYIFAARGAAPIWRERGICASCGMNTRMRSALDWILHEGLERASTVFCTEGTTPFFRALVRFFPLAIGSEFVPGQAPLGNVTKDGLRCESLEHLSFPDDSFDLVASLDVLEHVFDYRSSLREIHRVLRPNGVAVITVPFLFGQAATVCRARREGDSIRHELPPVYHGDPMNNSGALLVFDYGWDLMDEIRAAGFRQPQFVMLFSESKKYFGMNYILRLEK